MTTQNTNAAIFNFDDKNFDFGVIKTFCPEFREWLIEGCREWANDSEKDFFEVDTMGVDPKFFCHTHEIQERYPSSCSTYNYSDGVYYSASGDCFEVIITL